MTSTLWLAAALLSSPAFAQSTATFRGVDVYRSQVLSAEKAMALYAKELREYVNLKNARRAAMDAKAAEIAKAVNAAVAKLPGVSWAEVTFAEHFSSADHGVYAMFDVVDAVDRDRLAFSPAPTSSAADPDGLLAAWQQYFAMGSALSSRGELPVERPECPGFYCLWGGATPELAALQSKFVVGATAKEKELKDVVAKDADGEKRAAALFVLSYGTRGERVVEICVGSLRDPAAVVRSAALQILADVVNHHPKLRLDSEKITPLLDDPTSSVRGKAMGLLIPMTDDAERRRRMLPAAPRLVELLRLKNPESRALSFTLLGLLSRKDFPRDDHAKWRAWAEKAAATGKAD